MKKSIKNYKGLLLLLLAVCSATVSFAQVGIGTNSPDASAALDIKSTNKGLLVPSLTTSQKNAILLPATGLMLYDNTLNCLVVNKGTPAAPDWDCTLALTSKFFYMPSINISTSPSLIGIPQTKDLYAEYVSEFSSPVKASVGAPATIPYFANPTDLQYYVTYCDPSLIDISGIDANGVMRYTIRKNANYDSYINIVFVPK